MNFPVLQSKGNCLPLAEPREGWLRSCCYFSCFLEASSTETDCAQLKYPDKDAFELGCATVMFTSVAHILPLSCLVAKQHRTRAK